MLKFNYYNNKENVPIKEKLSDIELYSLFKSLELVKLIDPSQSYSNYEKIPVYWMESKKFAGLTVWNSNDKLICIFLDKSLKIKNYNDNFQYLNLGAIYSHELSHALNYTKDPHTSSITEQKIYSIINTNTNAVNLILHWKPISP